MYINAFFTKFFFNCLSFIYLFIYFIIIFFWNNQARHLIQNVGNKRARVTPSNFLLCIHFFVVSIAALNLYFSVEPTIILSFFMPLTFLPVFSFIFNCSAL